MFVFSWNGAHIEKKKHATLPLLEDVSYLMQQMTFEDNMKSFELANAPISTMC